MAGVGDNAYRTSACNDNNSQSSQGHQLGRQSERKVRLIRHQKQYQKQMQKQKDGHFQKHHQYHQYQQYQHLPPTPPVPVSIFSQLQSHTWFKALLLFATTLAASEITTQLLQHRASVHANANALSNPDVTARECAVEEESGLLHGTETSHADGDDTRAR